MSHPGQTALKTVLDTTELFEHILLQLPTKDLLFAQGVSHHFQAVIAKSPLLQKKLFFASPDSTPHNEKLVFTTMSAISAIYANRQPSQTELARLNPLFLREILSDSAVHKGQDDRADATCAMYMVRSEPMALDSTSTPDSHVTTATSATVKPSWKRMYITQPPVSVRLFCTKFGGMSAAESKREKGENKMKMKKAVEAQRLARVGLRRSGRVVGQGNVENS